jgi:uncharacterized protein (UPF0335 family)
MTEHIERMKTEHKELSEKIKDLNKFIHGNKIFKTLNDLDQSRMIKQSGFMESYASVLSDRVWVAGGSVK